MRAARALLSAALAVPAAYPREARPAAASALLPGFERGHGASPQDLACLRELGVPIPFEAPTPPASSSLPEGALRELWSGVEAAAESLSSVSDSDGGWPAESLLRHGQRATQLERRAGVCAGQTAFDDAHRSFRAAQAVASHAAAFTRTLRAPAELRAAIFRLRKDVRSLYRDLSGPAGASDLHRTAWRDLERERVRVEAELRRLLLCAEAPCWQEPPTDDASDRHAIAARAIHDVYAAWKAEGWLRHLAAAVSPPPPAPTPEPAASARPAASEPGLIALPEDERATPPPAAAPMGVKAALPRRGPDRLKPSGVERGLGFSPPDGLLARLWRRRDGTAWAARPDAAPEARFLALRDGLFLSAADPSVEDALAAYERALSASPPDFPGALVRLGALREALARAQDGRVYRSGNLARLADLEARLRPLAVPGAPPPRAASKGARKADWTVDWERVEWLDRSGFQSVVVRPSSPSERLTVFDKGAALDPERGGAERAREEQRLERLIRLGAAPRIVTRGTMPVRGPDGRDREIHYLAQERIEGHPLKGLQPGDLQRVRELFDLLVEGRIRLDEKVPLQESVRIGRTPSSPQVKAWVVDASGYTLDPERGAADRLLNRPDPLRAHYDDRLRRLAEAR